MKHTVSTTFKKEVQKHIPSDGLQTETYKKLIKSFHTEACAHGTAEILTAT